jgi:hypothetical protein
MCSWPGSTTAPMQVAEQEAHLMGKTVLSLFTRHGSQAERLSRTEPVQVQVSPSALSNQFSQSVS